MKVEQKFLKIGNESAKVLQYLKEQYHVSIREEIYQTLCHKGSSEPDILDFGGIEFHQQEDKHSFDSQYETLFKQHYGIK
jgi:hypothetical protein